MFKVCYLKQSILICSIEFLAKRRIICKKPAKLRDAIIIMQWLANGHTNMEYQTERNTIDPFLQIQQTSGVTCEERMSKLCSSCRDGEPPCLSCSTISSCDTCSCCSKAVLRVVNLLFATALSNRLATNMIKLEIRQK